MHASFADLPCGQNCLENCSIRKKMLALQSTLVPMPNDYAAELVRAFFQSYQQLCRGALGAERFYSPDIAIPALFDLVVSAKYAERQVSDGGWVYCAGDELNESPALYFPFLKTCPRCSVKRNIKPSVKSNKPGSDTIGDIASDATLLILAEMLRWMDNDAKLAGSIERRGDVDAVIYDQQVVALIEIKSSPLSVYPLEISLEKHKTEVRDGQSVPMRDHSPATSDLTKDEITFYLPHIDVRIDLGVYNPANWPYPALIEFVQHPENTARIISAWKDLYDVYVSSRGRPSRTPVDPRRWLTYGCGSPVDDSKNAPGMDRTDDIKKGTYQVLKLGTYFKEHCQRKIIRSVLASNFLPIHQFDRYLAEVKDVVWTKEIYSVQLPAIEGQGQGNVKAYDSDRVFNLFDALIGFTRSIYQDRYLSEITSMEQFIGKFCE